MKKITAFIFLILNFFFVTFSQISSAQDKGLVTIASTYSVKETADRFVETVTSKGLTLFARIDHAANASKSGLTLRPTELVIFGNPKAGTPLMQDNQISGIDLPLKVLIWEDENEKVWLTYNDPKWIAARHSLSDKPANAIKMMETAIKGMVEAVVSK